MKTRRETDDYTILGKIKTVKYDNSHIRCPECNALHIILYGKRYNKLGRKVTDKTLAYYTCGDDTFLVKGSKRIR